MLTSWSIWATALAIFSLCCPAAGYIVPDECVEDDVLLSLQEWIADADPFCRTLLDIEDITSTVTLPTSRTTITEHGTTDVTIKRGGTTTVPSATVTISVSATAEPPSIKFPKRAPAPNVAAQFYKALPFAQRIRDGSAPAALYSSVSTGCECLYLETQTVQIFSAPKTTRTLTANARQTVIQYSNTLLTGFTTQTAVATPSIPLSDILTSRSTISILTTPISLETTITLPIPTLPSSGFSASISGNLSVTGSLNLSTSVPTIPTPSLAVAVPSLSIPASVSNLTSFSTKPLPSGTVLIEPFLNLTSILLATGVPSTATSSSIIIPGIIGSTGLPLTIPSFIKPIGPSNKTSVIGSTGLPTSTPSFTIPSSPINITSVIRSTGVPISTANLTIPSVPINITGIVGSTGFPLPTPSVSATNSFNISLNVSITNGPTASLIPSIAPFDLRNYTDLSSSCSSLGLLFSSAAITPPPVSRSVTIITSTLISTSISTSIFVVTSVLPLAPIPTTVSPATIPIPTSRRPIISL